MIPRHKSLGIKPTIHREPRKAVVIGDGVPKKPTPITKRKPPAPQPR